MEQIIGKILEIIAQHKLFDEGVELIGSWCFQLYRDHLGAKPFPLRTQDIDFLIPNPFRGTDHPDFIKNIEKLGFQYNFRRDGSLYLWNAEIKIEFITPEKGRGTDKSIRIKKLRLTAIPLRFVALLLEGPISIKTNGVSVLVPNPTDFCLHKLIISARRRKYDKGIKDLQQALCTSAIADTNKMKKQYQSLPKSWQSAIKRMLDKARDILPMYDAETENLLITLQNEN